jgi:hypothetical protein
MRVSIWPEYLGIHSMRQWRTCFHRSLLAKAFKSSTELLGAFKCSSSFYARTDRRWRGHEKCQPLRLREALISGKMRVFVVN